MNNIYYYLQRCPSKFKNASAQYFKVFEARNFRDSNYKLRFLIIKTYKNQRFEDSRTEDFNAFRDFEAL